MIGNQPVQVVKRNKVLNLFKSKEVNLLTKFIGVEFFQAGGDEYFDLCKLKCFSMLFATTSSPQTKGECLHDLLMGDPFGRVLHNLIYISCIIEGLFL